MKEIMKLGLILLIISGISATLLGFTNEVTKNQIANQRELESQKKRVEVLSAADKFEKLSQEKMTSIISKNDKVKEIYIGYKNDNVVGYVVKTMPVGFGGPVEVITGISLDGKLSGVRVGSHQETPGLGANATLPSFYTQYNGKDANNDVSVSKTNAEGNQIQAISGATITSKAVTRGVNFSIEAVKFLKE
ncbi:RnfABCDGE type electron transport complex subunit G [Helicovermis profundi]|uniref:Ion-translocating oxidoreductase complex subunit G n=1 Tax=Helicovermis profundi TaxID=3065157 RepID=A0AAU9ED46_9FIRM|nr:RnfABCDGE type electron transport complex subunit G [Clostridia bacterium S502]